MMISGRSEKNNQIIQFYNVVLPYIPPPTATDSDGSLTNTTSVDTDKSEFPNSDEPPNTILDDVVSSNS